MGMRAQCRRITSAELEQIRRNPEEVEDFVLSGFPPKGADAKAALQEVQEIARVAKASGRMDDPLQRERLRDQILGQFSKAGFMIPHEGIGDDSTEGVLNLEKSWHVLHYLLTGRSEEAPPPLGNAIMGGEEVGEDRDYGRVRFLTPEQVHEVAEALAKVSKNDLSQRFDLEAMKVAKIYTARDQSDLDLAQEYFDQLLGYYRAAAANDEAMLLWIE